MLNNEDRPGVEEQYSQACTSSNLRVEADRRSAADVLIASGMSNSRLGGALMRLRSEYGSDSVPRRNASATDHRLMMGRLKTLPAVLSAVAAQAHGWGIERPEAVALAVVSHWLDNICQPCSGQGKTQSLVKIDVTQLRSKQKEFVTHSVVKPCKHCKGAGRIDLTHGSAGRRMDGFIAACVGDWATRTKRLLHDRR